MGPTTRSEAAAGAGGSVRRAARRALTALPPGPRLGVLHALGRYAPWEAGFDTTPPAPAPAEEPGPPDFVGIGVQKAGTTWWYDLLVAHPRVWHRPDLHKERHLLDRLDTLALGAAAAARYHGWFPRPPGMLAGEWTPDYVLHPWVAPLLEELAPAARLLVLVRDPVERLRSGLAHHRRTGGDVTGAVLAEAVARGFYHRSLAPWAGAAADGRLLVLQYERCVADPVGQLRRTYAFLGLDHHVPEEVRRPVNVGGDVPPLEPGARRRLAEVYAADARALAEDFGVDLSLWPSMSGAKVR